MKVSLDEAIGKHQDITGTVKKQNDPLLKAARDRIEFWERTYRADAQGFKNTKGSGSQEYKDAMAKAKTAHDAVPHPAPPP